MEMQTSTIPPKAPRLTVEEDALTSQVLEIIGGFTLEALQTLEEPEERDVWSMEEGDDSVFYSDEDQARQDSKANACCDFSTSKGKHRVNGVTADEVMSEREDDPGEESINDQENSNMKKGLTQQVNLSEQGEEWKALQTPKTEPMDLSGAADPGAQSHRTPEKSVSTCGESLQLNCTHANMQTWHEQSISAEKVNLPVQEEEALLDIQAPNHQCFDAPNERSYKRLNRTAEVPEQMPGVELQTSVDRHLQVDPEPGEDHIVQVPPGFHQSPSPGYSTLPLQKNSFDHLMSSKYSTVSYRKIRRGNTRQKIEKFEYMTMNL